MKKGFLRKVQLTALFCLAFAGVLFLPQKPVYAATPVQVSNVQYSEEQIVVLNNGNTRICFASENDAAKNRWEIIDADSGSTTTIDFSWLTPTSENIIMIKGADDTTGTVSRVVINKKPDKLAISINYANINTLADSDTIASLVNIMSSAGNGKTPVLLSDLQWRKGTAGQWKDTSSLTLATFKKFLVKGTFLYFRIKAVDDNATGADGTKGRRFSDEVKLKITKIAVASSYDIDGEKFTAGIKAGKEYRVTLGSSVTGWIQVTDKSVRSISLSKIVNDTLKDGSTKDKAYPAMKIEVRDYATTKAAPSGISTITIAAQRTIDNAIKDEAAPASATASDTNIYVSYSGSKYLLIQIPSASSSLPYEYCIVKSGTPFDNSKAAWISITKGTQVKVMASKAVEGGILYVRKKEIPSSSSENVVIASTYVTDTINYPSMPEIEDAKYIFIKGGYSSNITFTVTLNVAGKVPYETSIKSIRLGTKDIGYDVTSDLTSSIKTLKVTLKAESLSTLADCYEKALSITYANGTLDKTSIKLTVQVPTAAGTLTVTNTKGTTSGTAFTVVTTKAVGDAWYYAITNKEVTGVYTVDALTKALPADIVVTGATTFTTATMDNITATAGQYLVVFEVNTTSNYVMKYKCIKLTTDFIK